LRIESGFHRAQLNGIINDMSWFIEALGLGASRAHDFVQVPYSYFLVGKSSYKEWFLPVLSKIDAVAALLEVLLE
jgi:hypothetical protein